MTQENLMKYGVAAGVLYAAWKFGNAPVRTGAIAVAAVIVARRVPYLSAAI